MHKIIILLFLFGSTIPSTFACKCDFSEDVKTNYENTGLIVHGRILSKEFVRLSEALTEEAQRAIQDSYKEDAQISQFLKSFWLIKVEMEIIMRYKGKSIPKKIIVHTGRMAASCGFLQFEVGKEFQVYLSSTSDFDYKFKKANLGPKDYPGYWTNRCTATKEFDSKEDKILKKLMRSKKI